MHLYPIDGVAGRVAKDATAWNYRDAKWAMVMVGVSPDPADNAHMIEWARDYWEALHPYSAGGAYINMMMDEGQDRVRASYGEQLRPAGSDQGHIRPEQSLPRQSEHPTGIDNRATWQDGPGIESQPVLPSVGPRKRRISPILPALTPHSRPRPRRGGRL